MGLITNILRSLFRRGTPEQSVELMEQSDSWDPATSWYGSEEEELEERLQEQVWETLEGVRVNTAKRRVLFPGGLRLTLPQTVGHLQKLHSEVPEETLESALFEWLETNVAPENVTQEQMDEHDQIIESWIADYWKNQGQALEYY